MTYRTAYLDELVEDPHNARLHDMANLTAIRASLLRFGQVEPLVVRSGTQQVVGGNGRLQVMRALGWETAEIREVDLSDDEAIALGLALNRTAELATWDETMLRMHLKTLSDAEFDIGGFALNEEDLKSIKFDVDEPTAVEGKTDPDEVPEPPAEPITKPGDLWILGNHRLLCGDSTKPQHVERLMDGKKAAFAIADPPYNVCYEYNEHKDNKSVTEYSNFCTAYVNNALSFAPFAVISPGKGNELHYMKMPSYIEFLTWYKKFGLSRGSCFRAMTTEPLMLHGTKPKNMFYNTDCFEIMTEREPGLRKLHSCPKPVALWQALIEPMTSKSDIVLEMFGGSGTTVIACEKTNRHCRMMELDPAYCDVIVKRWEDFTGQKAVRA